MKISRKSALIFLMLLVMMPPNALTNIGIIKNLFNLLQLLFVFWLAARLIKSNRYSAVFVISCLFALIVLISSCIKSKNYYDGALYCLDFIGFLLLLEYVFSDEFSLAIERLYKYYFTLCMANYFYLVVFHFLLGNTADNSLFITVSNSISSVLIFTVVLSVLNDRYNNNGKLSIRSVVLFLSLIHTEILVWSGTGLIGFAIIMIFVPLCYRKDTVKVNFRILSIIGIALSVAVVLFRVQDKFSYLIESVLGKDLSLTGRTVIWDYYINQIKNSWLIGYGAGYSPYSGGTIYAHNGYIDLMIKGGTLGIVSLVILIVFMNREFVLKNEVRSSNLIAVAIFSFVIMMIAEMPSINYLIGFFVIEWYMREEYCECLE